MKKLLMTLTLAAAVMVPSVATATDATDATTVVSPDDDTLDPDEAARVGNTNRYEFDDDLVEGELLRPNSDLIRSRGFTRHTSLISLRADFMDVLYKLALDAPTLSVM